MTTGVTMVTGAVEGFDYAVLDVETRVVVQQRTGEIRSLVRRSAQDIIEIGLKLGEVKGRLGYGGFGRWLDAEFQWSQDTAGRFMQVAQRFGQIPQIADFAPSALYLLAAPSTPEEAVEEALDRAGGGERITHATAKAIVEGHRPAAPAAASSQATPERYASGLPVLAMPMGNGGGADTTLEAEAPVDAWAAAWAEQRYDTLTDRCQRLAAAMVEWAASWTDDKGRMWIDVVARNPQHANSPFRQDAVAECRRRGVRVPEEAMAEAIRRLFGLLVASDNLLLLDGGEQVSGVRRHESGVTGQGAETLAGADLRVMRSAPGVVVHGDRPLPGWVSGEADVVTEGTEGVGVAGELAPVSLREGYDSDEWYTPGWVIEAARRVMGGIDLDPASCELAQGGVGAGTYWAKTQGGERATWFGRVWLNPPYSAPGVFVEKLIEEYTHGNVQQALVLLNNSTETRWFQRLLARFPVCFFGQRLAFWRHDHAEVGARQGQAAFYLGPEVDRFCAEFGEFGIVARRMD